MSTPLLAVSKNCWPQRLAPIWPTARRLARCRRGIAAVEFALVLGPFMLFLFGIIGFGLVTYAQSNMVSAARDAARHLSVADDLVTAADIQVTCGSAAYNTVVADAAPGTAAEQIACDNLAGWATLIDVRATECVVDRDVTVAISTDASDIFRVDIFGFFTSDLEAEVTMRRQAECPAP